MKMIQAIMKISDTSIHEPSVKIDIFSDNFRVVIEFGTLMANEDALAAIQAASEISKIACENGFEPADTPSHFEVKGMYIVYIMEFFPVDTSSTPECSPM